MNTSDDVFVLLSMKDRRDVIIIAQFVGRAVAALVSDPAKMQHSGTILSMLNLVKTMGLWMLMGKPSVLSPLLKPNSRII